MVRNQYYISNIILEIFMVSICIVSNIILEIFMVLTSYRMLAKAGYYS